LPRGDQPRFDHRDRAGGAGNFHVIRRGLWFVRRLHLENDMQIGFNLPISGPLCEPGIVTRIAREGEALG